MRKLFLAGAMVILSQASIAATSISIKDNSDIALTLSQANYNRLVVKNDKIVEAVFPPNAMGIKRDEQDGSVYVMLTATNPFTLFLTTESGRHFSVTLNGEDTLGKTIELVPLQVVVQKTNPVKNVSLPGAAIPESIVSLITHMERREYIQGVNVKHQYGRVERWKGGLTLLPKESWEGSDLKGEIIEVYNSSKEPLKLSESWFANDSVKAIKFSKATLAPKETAMLYRVQGVAHG
ncbi:type-F conjugative transfer system secretin TraK [Legionella quateirensis]|uniref:Conjugative transfer protein TraK n=1 Tax=Legionella quateirensis TaxID=45072 RepID=A0A378KP53_9GAMM|nr:type-F conjugative transfer system secretin TraK [Legionella quateirensis]KTD47791.1 conjugative transfer protein TraK [Legionella quateirensis]STY16684.1 conjugative transfer protein TraK [Legionella quateirensis]